MPNLYATLTDISDVAANAGLDDTTFKDRMVTLLDQISRFIDEECNRVFYPRYDTRVFDGSGERKLYVGDLYEINNVYYSEDDGQNYTEITEGTDFYGMRGQDYNHPGSYDNLMVDKNTTSYNHWLRGQKSIKVVGEWGYTVNRSTCWENTGDTVQDAPLSNSATSLTVSDIDGADLYGKTPRIDVGNLLKIEDEFVEVVAVNTGTQVATIIRGVNGTTAAAHVQNTPIYKWKVHPMATQACVIQVNKQFKRGQAGFADAEANLDLGKVMHIKVLDPEALASLARIKRIDVSW